MALDDDTYELFLKFLERKSEVDANVEEAKRELAFNIAQVREAEEELKQVNLEVEKHKAELAAALAKKAIVDKMYEESETKLKNIAPKMAEAQVIIDDWERRCKENSDAMERAREELLRLKYKP